MAQRNWGSMLREAALPTPDEMGEGLKKEMTTTLQLAGIDVTTLKKVFFSYGRFVAMMETINFWVRISYRPYPYFFYQSGFPGELGDFAGRNREDLVDNLKRQFPAEERDDANLIKVNGVLYRRASIIHVHPVNIDMQAVAKRIQKEAGVKVSFESPRTFRFSIPPTVADPKRLIEKAEAKIKAWALKQYPDLVLTHLREEDLDASTHVVKFELHQPVEFECSHILDDLHKAALQVMKRHMPPEVYSKAEKVEFQLDRSLVGAEVSQNKVVYRWKLQLPPKYAEETPQLCSDLKEAVRPFLASSEIHLSEGGLLGLAVKLPLKIPNLAPDWRPDQAIEEDQYAL